MIYWLRALGRSPPSYLSELELQASQGREQGVLRVCPH